MANEIYVVRETTIAWTDSSGDYAMTLANLAGSGVGRVGAQGDLGAGATSEWYMAQLFIAGFASAPQVGESVDLFLAWGDGTRIDGNVGASDAALASLDVLPNLHYALSCYVMTTTTTDDIVASAIVRIPTRYVTPVVVNNVVGDNLENTSNVHFVRLTPIPPQVQ